ncbi:DUF4282 domain-containing protein [Halalkalibacter alkaliphilus]|uniref:DUF4282 domain-containing protein n=1 Tax=Halalkalibacter alkaliphilus TaxID=2917993 RepID=A0A9X2I4U5_9BACI|nr:DUF4282 domain-containing protein [Halalkalibacter alkaliphilus]MCL7748027.1 DUF4282 domain-containing protein [Halalkalibacter alkaliphilus]
MNQYLNFDKMITPAIIKIIFWIGVAVSVITGLIMIISGAASPWGGGLQVISGLFVMFLGPLVTRIYCELLILFFKMQQSLNEISSKLDVEEEEYRANA